MTAATYLLRRIADDPRLAYHFDPITTSMEMLTKEVAAERGEDLEEFRKRYYATLKFEKPMCSDCRSRQGE
jgi:hypothetical protein